MDRRTLIVTTGLGAGLTGYLDGIRNEAGGANEPNDSSDRSGSGTEGATSDDDGGGETTSANDENTADSSETETDCSDDADDANEESADRTARDVTFDSCTRATVTGTFEAGDVAFANTGFYDDGLFGDTILEDGVVFGEDVDAPFSGTVVFEIGTEAGVTVESDRVVVSVSDYGSDGTVITSLTTRPADYRIAAPTHRHPRASECLAEIEADSG